MYPFIHTAIKGLHFAKKHKTVFVQKIYHPLYGMNNYVLIWGYWLLCDPLRGSHDSQSPHTWG